MKCNVFVNYIKKTFLIFVLSVDYRRQRALDSLQRFRDVGRPFETHNSLTFSWSALPYPLNPITWFTHYHLLDDFVRQSTETRQTWYIHGRVLLPFPVMSNF